MLSRRRVCSGESVSVPHRCLFAGEGCDAPVRTCLTFGSAADNLVRSGLAEPISNDEAMVILAERKRRVWHRPATMSGRDLLHVQLLWLLLRDDAIDQEVRHLRRNRSVQLPGDN